ncbi:riboflavin synthase [Patescibacteria group bacterium]|nr:riboflavin synthase [Patescibacteria group bacterium]
MFTGIIKEIGKVTNAEKSGKNLKLKIQTQKILEDKKIGDSIAINGACSTIVELEDKEFTIEAMPETLEKTNLSLLTKNSQVNLEDSLRMGDRLDGHLVQGHIDGMGEVKKSGQILQISFPKKLAQYLALKGSITINGVSLTISGLTENSLSVDLIPHTLKETNLSKLKTGNKVNLEIDTIARYLKSLLDNKEKETKYEYLTERGFL